MRDDFGNQNKAGAPMAPQTQMYTTNASEPPMDAGKVIAIAGGAAGAIAGLWVLMSEREKKQEPASTVEQAKALIDEAMERARSEGMKAEASLLTSLQSGKKESKKKRGKAKKTAAKKVRRAEAERSEMVDRVADLLKTARADVEKKYGDDISKLVRQLRSDAVHSLDEGRKRSQAYSKRAKQDAERARKEAASLAETLKARAIEAEHQAEKSVKPLLQEWGHEAQHLVEAGKGRTEELRKRAEKDVIPEAKKRAEELRKKAESEVLPEAKKRAEELRKKAESDLLPEARKSLETGSAEAVTRLSTAAHAVEEQASEAGEAVKRGGRETRSLLLWVALAGVLIFTVFLDEEQQKRLKEIAFEIFGEAKDMYDDMKGESSSSF